MKLALLAVALAAPALAQPADLVIENARIWTDGPESGSTFAAVVGGQFIHVGAPDPRLIGPRTTRVDAQGRVVIPGMIDSHVHMLSGGTNLSRLQLRDAASREEFIARIKEWTEKLQPGEWVLGGRWSTESWPDRTQPTKEWLDPVTGDHALFLPRMDGHSAIVNSNALVVAGITRDWPPDPEGGVIDRDPATGEPTGILRESAMSLVSRLIPPASLDDKVRALRAAMREANRHGITAVGDIPGITDLPAYNRLKDGPMSVRFFLYPTASDWPVAVEAAQAFEARPGWVEVKGFKTYMDGSLGSRTAYMSKPFLGNRPDRADWRGLLREDAVGGKLERNLAAAAAAGYQSIAHAIGDEANRLLLDALEGAYPNLRQARCRSEHAQHLLPADIARFGSLGVIASMQPHHKADDGRYCEDYIGPERSRTSYAFKSLLAAGAVVCFGSDWPVVTISPFAGIEAAVTARTLDGKVWQAQEALTAEEALRCYTSRAAYAAFADRLIGRVAPGYRADFVILSADPLAPRPDWASLAPTAVYVEARQVFPRP